MCVRWGVGERVCVCTDGLAQQSRLDSLGKGWITCKKSRTR